MRAVASDACDEVPRLAVVHGRPHVVLVGVGVVDRVDPRQTALVHQQPVVAGRHLDATVPATVRDLLRLVQQGGLDALRPWQH